MPTFIPACADVESRVRASFSRQSLMTTLGARLTRALPGEVQIELPFSESLLQQQGFMHAGGIASIVDSACGYAALTLLTADKEVVSVEFKINFLSPAKGTSFVAIGKVIKAGRTITVCSGEVIAMNGDSQKAIALMQATMMAVPAANG
jgi:uncharacterized protein (TIGR00369 family)